MAEKAEPHVCRRCQEEGSYCGMLRFPGDPIPKCHQHGNDKEQWIEMEPVFKENK